MSGPRLERVAAAGGKRVVDVEHGATKGAMLGRDLYDTDGTVISSLVDWIRTRAVAKDTARINGIPVDKIITRNGTLIVREIQAEAIQAGNLGSVVAITGGGITAASGGNSLMLGAGFGDTGTNDLVAWFGPTPGSGAMADATKAGSLFWIDNTGSAYFGGTLSAPRVIEQQAYTAPANGANMLPNATFTQYLMGETVGAVGLNNKQITDGWVAFRQEGASSGTSYVQANAGYIRCQVCGTTVTVPASGIVAPQARTAVPFAVEPGAVYSTNFYATYAYNGGLTAGITAAARMTIIWFDASGAQVSVATPLSVARGSANGWAGWFDITAPSTAATAHVFLDVLVSNANGSPTVAATSTVALQANFYSVVMAKKSLLAIAGSGVRLGDTRNAPAIMVGNGSAKVPTAPTYTASAGTPATATISVPAFTMLSGSLSPAYSAMSVGVTGTNGATVNYFLYCDDPGLKGGSRTLVATTNGNTAWQGDDRIYLGAISVTFPTSGSGSGGGAPGGGGNSCVDADAWVAPGLRAHQVRVDDWLDCLDLPSSGLAGFRRQVTAVSLAWVERVRLVSEGGAELELSADTPMDVPDGRSVLAERMIGEEVVTDRGLERVASVRRIGAGWVVRISVGGVSYAAGSRADYRIYSHNSLKP